jgi:hypothetical protein
VFNDGIEILIERGFEARTVAVVGAEGPGGNEKKQNRAD